MAFTFVLLKGSHQGFWIFKLHRRKNFPLASKNRQFVSSLSVQKSHGGHCDGAEERLVIFIEAITKCEACS